MTDKKKPGKAQPKLSKAKLKSLDAEYIPHVREAWESYHSTLEMLLEQNADEEEIEEVRDFATYYYESYLDLLIGTRKKV